MVVGPQQKAEGRRGRREGGEGETGKKLTETRSEQSERDQYICKIAKTLSIATKKKKKKRKKKTISERVIKTPSNHTRFITQRTHLLRVDRAKRTQLVLVGEQS